MSSENDSLRAIFSNVENGVAPDAPLLESRIGFGVLDIGFR